MSRVHVPIGRKRVLVVDDSRVYREHLRDTLAAMGYDVETAGTAPEAMMKVASGADLVILDLVLRSEPGYDLLRRIHERPDSRDLPVVMVSAHHAPENLEVALAAGASDFLTKPIESGALEQAVSRLLRKPRAT